MRKLIIIPFLFICLSLSSAVYYVAPATATPAGNDANAGTILAPWLTWGKAFSTATAGDTVYFRGGVYPMDIAAGVGYTVINDGTAADTIKYWAYPGEEPILDCDAIVPTTNNYGIHASASYVWFKGLTIRNVWQDPSYGAIAWYMVDSHVKYENCKAYNIHGSGWWHRFSNEVTFLNCDAWNCCDSLTTVLPGNDGYGFMNYNYTVLPSNFYYIHCRAWRCGDDGFQTVSYGYTEYDGCWSWANGMLEGGGNGFKLGLSEPATATPVLQKLVKNCLAVYNKASGVTTNDNTKVPKRMNIYNNVFYHNGLGFSIFTTTGTQAEEELRVFKNNINYANTTWAYIKTGAYYTHQYNSWDTPPGVTVSDADFTSVDTTGISGARDADGHLPDLSGFLHLAAGSDLIGAGIGVGLLYDADSAYHNDPPDLGAYAYSATPLAPPLLPSVTTTAITSYNAVSATFGGTLVSNGGTISARGVCWSTSANPTTASSVVYFSASEGTSAIKITTLKSNTTYYVRCFGTNESGTAYGANEIFMTPVHSISNLNGKIGKVNGKIGIVK